SLLSTVRPPPRSQLFPYTTLFRSKVAVDERVPRQLSDTHHVRRRLALGIRLGERLDLLQDDPNLIVVRQIVECADDGPAVHLALDRKSTRLNSSHVKISHAISCLK